MIPVFEESSKSFIIILANFSIYFIILAYNLNWLSFSFNVLISLLEFV